MTRLSVSGVVVAALMALTTPASVNAITNDKLAYLTFSAPVQVPGATLDVGTYRFLVTNPTTSRSVLQVLSHDGSIVYAMFHTSPDSRAVLTEEATVAFIETPAGVPPAVRTLFYGGEYRGYEFMYPKGGPNMIAPIVPQPEITYTPFPAAPAPAPAAAPEPEPVAAPAPEPVAEPIAEPLPAPEPAELPRTATPLPFVAVGGLTSLLAGLGIGLLRRRAN